MRAQKGECMNEVYQKVAYIGLRNPDGSFSLNVPLYVKLSEVNKHGISEMQEELIHRITEIMIGRYQQQIVECIEKKKGGKKNAEI